MKSLNPGISDWQDQRVWILGASSGIGAALAGQLQKAGARLAISPRREQVLREVAIGEELIAPVDVSDIDSLYSARDMLIDRWGGIDMVFYCAGTYTPMRACEIDLQTVRETLAINLQGVYNLLDVVLPDMVKKGTGGICLISSVAGYTGLPKALAYGPGKAALINLAQILCTDLSPRGIGIFLVNPGFVATRLTRKNNFKMPALITADAAAQEIIAGIGKGRFEIHFPKRFTSWMKCLSRMPDRIRFFLLKKAVDV